MIQSLPLRERFSTHLPTNYRTPEIEKRFVALGNALDSLALIDKQGTVYIDEAACQQFLTTFLPQESSAYCFEFLKEAPDQRFLSAEKSKGLTRISWIEATKEVRAKIVALIDTDDTMVSKGPTTQQLQQAIQKHVTASLPQDMMEPEVFYKHLQALLKPAEAEAASTTRKRRGTIGCLYDRLGFLGTLAVLALVGVISALVVTTIAITGGYGTAFWAVFWDLALDAGLMGVGVGILTIIVTCIISSL